MKHPQQVHYLLVANAICKEVWTLGAVHRWRHHSRERGRGFTEGEFSDEPEAFMNIKDHYELKHTTSIWSEMKLIRDSKYNVLSQIKFALDLLAQRGGDDDVTLMKWISEVLCKMVVWSLIKKFRRGNIAQQGFKMFCVNIVNNWCYN